MGYTKMNYSIKFLQFYKEYFDKSSFEDYENGLIYNIKDTKWTLQEVKEKLIKDNVLELLT
jgi:hypothetical protein